MKSQSLNPKQAGLDVFASGSVNITAAANSVNAPSDHSAQPALSLSFHGGAGFYNLDAVRNAIRKFPSYKEYFYEKLSHIKRLQEKLDNKSLRHKGENKEFLLWWIRHYTVQVNNTTRWLLKNELSAKAQN